MKKRLIVGLLICSVLLCIGLPISPKSYADPFTAAQIGAVAYAAMSSWGIDFTAANVTAGSMGQFMGNQIDSFVNSSGGSIASVFGSQLAIDVASKLVVGHQMYNALIDFKDWLVDKFGLSSDAQELSKGTYNGQEIGKTEEGGTIPQTGVGIEFNAPRTTKSGRTVYVGAIIYNNGVKIAEVVPGVFPSSGMTGEWYLEIYDNNLCATMPKISMSDDSTVNPQRTVIAQSYIPLDTLTWNTSNEYIAPTVIDPSYEWLGQVGDYQDTNLEQLLQHVIEDVEGNELIVEGDVVPVDPPQPTPTPMPIDPDTPMSDVPWEGMDTNLQNLYNQGLEEIGAIGDAKNAITDAVGVQTGVLEDAIADNAGFVSGAIGQAVSDIQDAISEQTDTLSESASATAEATESIAESLEDETINWQKFDLRGLFPFCIPFDIYNMLEALDASPTAPHVELPFVIESIGFSYTIDLDFSDFDTVAAVMRQMELIVYGIALAWATSKVIKW